LEKGRTDAPTRRLGFEVNDWVLTCHCRLHITDLKRC
jgi:hypothetical protein